MAVDRKLLINAVYSGLGHPIGSHYTPNDPGYIDLTGVYPHDPKKAKFALTSSEPGSTFECALSGKKVKKPLNQFKPCASAPKLKKLKPGKKQFQTRATDLAGNVDPTPAVYKWKVKPKKKK